MALYINILFYDHSKEYVSGHIVPASLCEDVIENYLKLYGVLNELRTNRYIFIKYVQCGSDRYSVEAVAQVLYDELCRRGILTVQNRKKNIRYANLEYVV